MLSDPVRLKLLGLFGARVLSAADAAGEMRIPLSNAAYHTRLLYEASLLVVIDEVKVRGTTKTLYRAKGAAELRGEAPSFPRTSSGRAEERVYESLLKAVEEATYAVSGIRRESGDARP